ncbi:IS607 family transposase [Crocosphaera sp. XPORK-15E]|uniref:IS607 family transposase n=1 Tax=Crocosphaera sp. XPORK-15E TaxID=3110247 RepID=UPI002B1FC755|nr:IS607 family transposase [Crocosphaera sp. XPORK-15E]MEA5535751.1 IS607 family transposase [Crocosphaera sp. XPORK-15E]
MKNLLSIQEAAQLLGVSTKTVRRWDKAGKIEAMRTPGGHRRFEANAILPKPRGSSLTVAYARINTNQSPKDLKQQVKLLETYCKDRDWSYQIIKDIGSGVNYKNKGLISLLELICGEKIERLVLTRKDRLLMLGADLILTLCEIMGVEVVIINSPEVEKIEENLDEDIQDIVILFRNHLYGMSNPTNAGLFNQRENFKEGLHDDDCSCSCHLSPSRVGYQQLLKNTQEN